MSKLTISNYDAATNTATMVREYSQGTLQHDITLDLPVGKTYKAHEVKAGRILLTLTDANTQLDTHQYYDSGLPAHLSADFISQFQATSVNPVIDIKSASHQVSTPFDLIISANQQQLTLKTAEKSITFDKEKAIQGLAYMDGLVVIYAGANGQSPSYEVINNATLQRRANDLYDKGTAKLNQKLNLARKNFLQKIEDMDADKFTADGYRVQDVMRNIDGYLTGMLSYSYYNFHHGNSAQNKNTLLATYTALNDMLDNPDKASVNIDLLKKTRRNGISNVLYGALVLLAASAMVGLAIAGIATLIPELVILSVLLLAITVLPAYSGARSVQEGVKDLTFNKDIALVGQHTKNQNATHSANKVVQLKDKYYGRFPTFQPKNTVKDIEARHRMPRSVAPQM